MSETKMLNGKDHISLLAKCNDGTYVAKTAKRILARHEKANNALAKMGISARYELYYKNETRIYALYLNGEVEEDNIRFEEITDAYLRSIGSVCADYWAMGETDEERRDGDYYLRTEEYASAIDDLLRTSEVGNCTIKSVKFENMNANKTLDKLGIPVRLICARGIGHFAVWVENTHTKEIIKAEEYDLEKMAVGMREVLRSVYWDNVDNGTF